MFIFKNVSNYRGSVLALVLFAVSFLSIAVMLVFVFTARVENQAAVSYEKTVYAARTCLYSLDNYIPKAAGALSCAVGQYVNLSTNPPSCTYAGDSGTVKTVGDCTCSLSYTSYDAVNNKFNLTSIGVCPSTGTAGSRTNANNKTMIAIDAALNACQTQTQVCGAGGGQGTTCRSNCGTIFIGCCTDPTHYGVCNSGSGTCQAS